MADEDDTKQQETQEKQETTKTESSDKKSLVGRFLPWIIIAVVVVIFAGAGLTVGRIFAGSKTSQTPGVSEQDQSAQVENLEAKKSAAGAQKTWYYDLEPVVANLNVTDVTRYVRASLTLEVSPEVDEQKGTAFFDEKKPILTNWLTVYLASLGLEDIRGDMKLKRLQSQVLDAFNEKLFPDSKPKIKSILFKEFAVQ
ncbi:MAG TPA: flagellar basal body-associated FliL family protein [Sedimentisphaerales bacterium]|nr:flagellar basal body-associated FliL family protein [Sedimentisphaerales bacterium]